MLRLKWWGSVLVLLGWCGSAFAASEMGSRRQTGSAPPVVEFLAVPAAIADVRIAPTARELSDAALESRDGAGVPPLAKALGFPGTRHPSAPRRVGSVFPSRATAIVPAWQTLADGSHVAHLRVSSAGALGIRARLILPPGLVLGELRVAAAVGAPAEAVSLQSARAGEIWTPYTPGAAQLIEIHTPQRVAAVTVQVADIVHFEEPLDGNPAAAVASKAAGACNPDVVCGTGDSAIDNALAERRRSVAQMNFQVGGGSFLCSGTLINSAVQENFFLTANHCIATQAEAASLQTRWFYESATCGGGAGALAAGSVSLAGGADLVFTNQFADSTLLRLRNAPPAGAVFAGWNAAPLAANTPIVSISHPAGDVMKLATGSLRSLQGRDDGLIRTSGYEQEFYAVLFERGIIEGGSSGSGLFTLAGNTLQLRGVLSSSTTRNSPLGLTCTNTAENANYSRFDYFQPQIAPLLNGHAYPADDFPNQPSVNASPITIHAASTNTVNATLSYLGDIDVFKLDVTQAGTLFARSSGGFDLIGNLMNAAGTTLATNDDNFSGNNEFGIAWQVTPGTYYLAVAAWDPFVNTTTGYSLSTSLTPLTVNHTALWWGGSAQSGWGLNVNHQGNTIFATMFNYEAAGRGVQNPGMWLVATLTKSATGDSYSGALSRVTGPAFNALPFTPIGAGNVTPVGNMRIDFAGAGNATLTYDVAGAGTGGTGLPVVKAMTRQAFGTLPVCGFTGSDRAFEFNVQDLWWNRAESGWGINFTHQDDTVFATLFTYEPGIGSANKGMWLTATLAGGAEAGVYAGDLLRVTGSAFDAVPFVPLDPAANVTKVGAMRVQFTTGNAATLTYDVNGVAVTKAIERQVFDNFRPRCE